MLKNLTEIQKKTGVVTNLENIITSIKCSNTKISECKLSLGDLLIKMGTMLSTLKSSCLVCDSEIG